jgi:holo-[acyl-carrier protein] synthase
MSQTFGLGVDMVEIDRIRAIYRRHKKQFLDRLFTPSELAYCRTKADPYPSLAARVAAKEAVAKAMNVGIGGILKWTSVCVEISPTGSPSVVLDAAAQRHLKKLGASKVLLSLSHTDTLAIATALLVK